MPYEFEVKCMKTKEQKNVYKEWLKFKSPKWCPLAKIRQGRSHD